VERDATAVLHDFVGELERAGQGRGGGVDDFGEQVAEQGVVRGIGGTGGAQMEGFGGATRWEFNT
jgi:hypothetical protein